MSHRRGQHEDSSHDATAGHSNTMPTTKMSAKDRLRQEEEQLDKLLTECGCGTDGMSLEDKRQLGAVLQTSKDDAVHEKHVRDLYEEQESFTHRSGITNGDSVHIDGHDISLDEDTDVTDVPHTDSSAVKRVNFSLQCSMSQDSTSDKDSDKESEGEIAANNVSLQCSRTESEPDDNQEVGTDSNDANIKSCSDDDSEYCSLSESEEEKKSDGNHLSVEKSVKTEFIKLKEEFVSSPVLGKKQKPEISKRLSKAQASKMKSVFLESDSDDSEIFDVSTSKTTNHNTNNAPINKHLVIASDSDSDSPPKKRHCTLNMQHQKSSSPVFEPEQDNINDTSTSMSDSDAFVGDSFSMISPSPLARQPLRRMQKKTESSIGAGSDVSVICETQPDMLNSSIDSSMGVSEHSYSVLDTNEETVINKAKNVDKSGSTPTVDTQDPLYSSNEGESKHHSVVSESQDLIDEESDADESATFDPSKMAALPGSDSELDGDATQDDSGLVGNSQNEQEADSSMKESDGSDAEEYVANTQDISGVKKIDHEGGMDVIAESQDIDVDNQSEQSECLFGGLSQIASFITSKNSSLDNDTAAEIGSSADDMPKLEMSADSSESERTTHRSADSLQCGQTVVTTADHSEDVELTSSMTMNSGSSEMDTVVEANKLDNQESSKPSVSDDIQIEEEEGLDLIGRLKHTQLKSPLLNPPSCHTTPTISAQVSPQPTISAQASPQPKTLKRHYKEPRLYDDKPYYSRDPLKTEAYASTIRGYFSTYHAMLAQAQARVQCHMPWSEPITSFSSKKTTTATNSRAERAQQRAARHNPIYVDVLSDGSDFEDDRLNAKKTSQRTNNDARGGFKSLSRLQRNRKDDVHEESDDLPDTEPMLLDDVSGDNAGSVRNRRHTSDSIGSGRSNASSSKPSSIASTNSTQQQQLIDELRTKHAQICRSPTGTKPGGSPGSDSGSTGPIGSSTPAPLRRRHSESITKLSHSSQQLASQHENIPNEGVSEESCHPVTSPISCTAPTPLRRGSTVQIPITSTQPPELCDTSSYIKRPDNRKIPARRCMLLEADIPRRHSSASTTGNKRKLLKIGYSDYRLDDDVGVSTLDVSRGEKERLNPEDQNEGKRHGVSKGLKRVVSDIDVTRKHRNTISNMTLSDINLGCTTAGSISTVSSTSSTTTSISESASLSPASSVFGVGSKQPDANIRTYASRGRGRRGRPPTRGSTLTVENLREHLAETIDLDSERESEKCGPTTKPRRRKKMFYDSDSEAESDSDYLPGPKTKKQVAKQVAKKGVTGTQKISGNHMHVVVVDIHRAEDSSKDSPKPKRKIAPSGPASAPSSADKESKKPAYRLAIDEMDTIEVDENYVQSPVKRGLKNLTRKRAAQDESRVAKKQRVEAESKTLKLVSEGESEFSDFDTGEMLSRRLNSKRHLANVRKQESAKKESAKKESAKKESAKKELVMMKKGSTKKDTGVSKKDSVKRGTSEKKKGSSKKEEGLNKNPNKSGKKKGPGESAQPKRGSKKLFTDSESDDEKSVDRKSKNEKPKVKDATASKIRSAAKSVKLLKTTATTKKNIVSEEKERKKEQEHKKSKTLSKDKTGDKEEQVADNTKNKPTKRGKKGGKVVPKKFAPIIQQSFLDISLSESDSEMAPPPAKIASTKSKHEVLRKDRPSRRALMDSADEMPVESICSPEIGRTRRGHAKMDVPPVVLNDSSNIKQSSKPKSKPVQNVQPSIRSSVRSSPRAAAVSANRDQVSRAGSSVPSTSKSSVNNDTSSDDCERLSRSRRSTEKVNYKALSQGQSEDENERGNSKKDASEKGGKKSTQELKCSAVKDKKSSKEKEDGPQMIECPMCYKSFTSDGIAEHASNCVGKTPAPSTRSPRQRQAKGNIDKDADNTDNKRLSMSTCPMCYDMFEQSKLQAHVNRCVEKAEENADLAVNKRQTRTRKT